MLPTFTERGHHYLPVTFWARLQVKLGLKDKGRRSITFPTNQPTSEAKEDVYFSTQSNHSKRRFLCSHRYISLPQLSLKAQEVQEVSLLGKTIILDIQKQHGSCFSGACYFRDIHVHLISSMMHKYPGDTRQSLLFSLAAIHNVATICTGALKIRPRNVLL